MNTMKQFIILAIGIILFQNAEAAGDARLTFEPLYGVETRLVRYPEPSRYVTPYKTRAP